MVHCKPCFSGLFDLVGYSLNVFRGFLTAFNILDILFVSELFINVWDFFHCHCKSSWGVCFFPGRTVGFGSEHTE